MLIKELKSYVKKYKLIPSFLAIKYEYGEEHAALYKLYFKTWQEVLLAANLNTKGYLPFVDNWEGKDEFPLKQNVPTHKSCMYYHEPSRKCIRTIIDSDGNKIIRDVVVGHNGIDFGWLCCQYYIKHPRFSLYDIRKRESINF
jgi:hypothetical protein